MLIKLGNPVKTIPPTPFAEKYWEKHLEDILEKTALTFLGFDVLLYISEEYLPRKLKDKDRLE